MESIYEIKDVLNINNQKWEGALQRGIKFYIENQFLPDGSSYWRLPKRYPIEIHNQAQGIITFLKSKDYCSEAEKFAFKIADWTIKNMQSKDGHFYYQNFKYYKNKISYMRWNQTWMFLALVNLIESDK